MRGLAAWVAGVSLAIPGLPTTDAHAADGADAAASRGRVIFETRCATCHGTSGKGDGRVAKLYTPKPSDLTASTRSDTYKAMIIRKGGAYVGRSLIMPSWESELSAAEIGDVVAYLAVLSAPGAAGAGK